MAVEYLGDGAADGVNFGRSATDKIGFYGLTTPIAKQTLTSAVVAGSSIAHVIRTLLELSAALKSLGIITTA